MNFNNEHIQKLKDCKHIKQEEVGQNAYQWATFFLNFNQIPKELNKKFNREELFLYCQNTDISIENAVIAILAWGGMNREHGKLLFQKKKEWVPVCENIRNGQINNKIDAFTCFQKLRKENKLPGLGIPYFTKLICFLNKNLNAYIMDQWTSKSINLLTGENIVDISKGGWVTDKNNEKKYTMFCSLVDSLSVELGCSGYDAEEKIFSVGFNRGEWRNYVKLLMLNSKKIKGKEANIMVNTQNQKFDGLVNYLRDRFLNKEIYVNTLGKRSKFLVSYNSQGLFINNQHVTEDTLSITFKRFFELEPFNREVTTNFGNNWPQWNNNRQIPYVAALLRDWVNAPQLNE